MMLRVLMIIMLFVAVGLGGCKKEEPKTIGEQMDQMKEEAEKTADDMADEAEDAVDEAEDMADDAKEAVEKEM